MLMMTLTLMLVLTLLLVGSEVALLALRPEPGVRARFLLLSLTLNGAGAVFSWLDVTRRWCWPDSWLQGHAVWHGLTGARAPAKCRHTHAYARVALAVWAAFEHYKQFRLELPR